MKVVTIYIILTITIMLLIQGCWAGKKTSTKATNHIENSVADEKILVDAVFGKNCKLVEKELKQGIPPNTTYKDYVHINPIPIIFVSAARDYNLVPSLPKLGDLYHHAIVVYQASPFGVKVVGIQNQS